MSDLKQFQFLSNNTVWTPADIASKVSLPTRTVTTSNGIDTLTISESAGLTADIENLTAIGSFDVRLVGNAGTTSSPATPVTTRSTASRPWTTRTRGSAGPRATRPRTTSR